MHGLSIDRFEVLIDGSGSASLAVSDAAGRSVSDSQVDEDQEHGERERHSPMRPGAVSQDDTAASEAWHDELPVAAAAEPRLDIRA
jgi:hypothetical protein